MDNRPKIAALLAGPLKMTPEEIIARIKPGDRYCVLKNRISEDTAAEIERSLGEYQKGITFEPNFERIYPEHQLLSHVVGFYGYEEQRNAEGKVTGGRFKGIDGIERSMDDWLAGQDGWRCFEKDGRGREIVSYRTEDRPARNGANVQLTVDLGLQQIVEEELEAAYKRYRPIRASAVMLDPFTGEVLSMANRPCYDPNDPAKEKDKGNSRINHAVAGVYEPGSTMKIVTCSGGLNFHKVTLDTSIWCENGNWMYGGKPLRDHSPYGFLTVAQVIEHSSNIGAAKIALGMGEEVFHGWLRNFGFGQATGIALPGEVRGLLKPRDQWSGISITRMAMGQEIGVTPLQIVTAASAIANGGNLMMPQILKNITDDSGQVVRTYEPKVLHRVMAPEIASEMCEALVRVTGSHGTAKLAAIAGYRIAGKTGTTQKYDAENGARPSRTKHVTSFVGFVPADKPAFCMVIVLDEAKVPANEDTGGMIVGPIFKAIAQRALVHLGIPPDPILLQQDLEAAKNVAKNSR